MLDPYVHVPVDTFDELVEGGSVGLPRDDDHHVRRVLRLGPGAGLLLSDGAGREADAQLTESHVTLVGEVARRPAPTPAIHVLQGLAKARKVDEVIRAATEFGVAAFTIVATERSVVELRGDKQAKVRARWEAVARSAAGQSRRPYLPTVRGPSRTTEVTGLASGAVGLVPHVGASLGLRAGLEARASEGCPEVAIAIGAEGGWTSGEVDAFEAAGWVAVSLGDSVLRTEHAGLVAAAAVAALVGRMD